MLATLLVSLLAAGPLRPSAAAWGERVIVADGDGTLSAFTLNDLRFDAAFSRQLQGDGLLAVARDGDVLWGFDGRRVFTWDDAGARWDLVKAKGPPAECRAFAVVARAPVCVTGTAVYRFTTGTVFEAPPFDGQVRGRGFGDAPHAVAAAGNQLAIGTGFGEWGGFLWLLDLETGAWSSYPDTLGNAVGIAWTGDAWAVAWSMSHFDATTRVRLHGRDAKPLKESARLRGKYLRTLAWDAEQQTLVGLEQQALVKVTPGLVLERLQPIGKVTYGPERNAVGVSPGIAQLTALGRGRYLIVPLQGPALVASGGKTVALVTPRSDGGR